MWHATGWQWGGHPVRLGTVPMAVLGLRETPVDMRSFRGGWLALAGVVRPEG